jgi:hypothetical protein
MTKIDRDQLIEIEGFEHHQVLAFIKEKALVKTWLTESYMVANGIVLALLVVILVWAMVVDLKNALLELAFVFLMIPLWIMAHEGIHGIVYKMIGAEKVTFDMHLKQFVFVTIVYDEVFSFKELIPVLLAPAVTLMIVPIVVVSAGYLVIGAGLLTFHILSIGGDLLLLNYYLLNKEQYELYTEDLRTKVSIIYKKA